MVLNERITWPGLPKLDINTHTNSTSGFSSFEMADVDKVTKRNASITFTDAYGSSFWASTGGTFQTNITIKGRGNTSWEQPKKPYGITLCGTNNFSKRNVNMFGMSNDSDWVIINDYQDKTSTRDLIAPAMAFSFGQWSPRGLKIEVYFNGVYQGLYTWMEKVKRHAQRINIASMAATDITQPNISGGYTLEQQPPNQLDDSEMRWVDSHYGKTFSYKVPDSDAIVTEQNNYIKAYYDDFITRVLTVSFSDLTNGYRAVADPVSIAQYCLLQDLFKNSDAYFASWYLTKDRGGLLQGGPFWDATAIFGLFEGNVPYAGWGGDYSDPNDVYLQQVCPWFAKLLTDPYFLGVARAQLAAALPKLHQAVADFEAYLPKLRGNLTRDGAGHDAVDREAIKWTNANNAYPGNFDRNNANMLAFMKARLYWHQRMVYLPATPQSATVPT